MSHVCTTPLIPGQRLDTPRKFWIGHQFRKVYKQNESASIENFDTELKIKSTSFDTERIIIRIPGPTNFLTTAINRMHSALKGSTYTPHS